MCANCGMASAKSFLSTFRKKETNNVCILCQRVPPPNGPNGAAGCSPAAHPDAPKLVVADGTATSVRAKRDGGAAPVASSGQSQQAADAAAPPPAPLPSLKPLPPSQASTHSEDHHVGEASFAGTGAGKVEASIGAQRLPASAVEAQQVATPVVQGGFAKQVDWTATTCRLCHRGYTTERRRHCCSKCSSTVCTACLHQKAGAPGCRDHECQACATKPVESVPLALGGPRPETLMSLGGQSVSAASCRGGSLLPASSLLGGSHAVLRNRPVMPSSTSFAAGHGLIAAPSTLSVTHGTSFRPTSMMRRAFVPATAAAAAIRGSNVPGGMHAEMHHVEVGSVRQKNSVAPSGGLLTGGGMSFRQQHPTSMMQTATAGSFRSASAAFVLGTTPMGSLPAHYFLSKKELASSTSNAVTVEGSQCQLLLHDVCADVPQERRHGLEHVRFVADVTGPHAIARDHLRACIDILIERHPLLRASFINGQLQVFPSSVSDFKHLSKTVMGSFAKAEQMFVNEMNKPFDLSKPNHATTLLRIRLLDRDGDDAAGKAAPNKPAFGTAPRCTIGFVFHKLIASTESASLFVNDLRILYQHAYQIIEHSGGANGEVKINTEVLLRVLPRQPVAYELYCQDEREFAVSPAGAVARQHWMEQLEKRVPLEMPVDRPNVPERPLTAALHHVVVTSAVCDAMLLFSKRSGVSLPTCYLAAFLMTLGRYAQSEDGVTVAVMHSNGGADAGDYRDTFGPRSNVNLHTILTDERSCAAFAQSVQQSLHSAEPYTQYPFRQAIKENDRGEGKRRSVLGIASVAFNKHPNEWASFMFGVDGAVANFAGLEWRSTSRYQNRFKVSSLFDVELHYWETRGKSHCVLEYNATSFDPETIQEFGENMTTLMRHLADRGGEAYTNLTVPCVAPRLAQALLYKYNESVVEGTHMTLSRGRGVVGLLLEPFQRCASLLALAMPEDGVDGVRLTYTELDERSNMVAHHLMSAVGVASNSVVAVAMPRCAVQLVCVLGILKAGAAYLPLDLSYPVDRLAFMLQDSNVACVFTSQKTWDGVLKPLLDACTSPVFAMLEQFDTITQPYEALKRTNIDHEIDPADSCYVMYTSGSTGRPKGVVMNHRALTNLVVWQNQYMQQDALAAGSLPSSVASMSSADEGGSSDASIPRHGPPLHVLQFSPISFDVSFQELFTTWSNGGALFMVSDALRLDPLRLISFLNQHKIQRIFLPFVALNHICETAMESGTFPTTLEDIITAGEQLVISRPLMDCVERLQQKHRVVVHNHYGPSETHVCTYHVLSGSPKNWAPLPPIGKAIANSQVYVLDNKRQLVPFGVVGELYVAGDCLGTGYLGNPEATQAAFVDCTFPSATSALMYKTGDLVQMKRSGDLFYVRRKDTQVKVRGFRIELGEIEAKLAQNEDIKKCCVIVRDDCGGSGEKTIVAYVVPHALLSLSSSSSSKSSTQDDNRLDAAAKLVDQWKQSLGIVVPAYMVPSIFVLLPSLPLTPSGKINRKGLPRPTEDDVIASSGGIGGPAGPQGHANVRQTMPPKTPTELLLARVWAEVLKRPVSAFFLGSNFFDMGGHSLTITKVSSRVTTMCNGLTIPLAEFFANPVLQDQAAMIDAATAARPKEEGVAGGAVGPEYSHGPSSLSYDASPVGMEGVPAPLTFNQQSLLFLCMSRPESAAVYNIALQGKLHGADLSVTEITDVFERVLQSHASLRTTYHQDEDGQFYQVVQEKQDLDINIAHLDEEEGGDGGGGSSEEDIKDLLRVEGNRPFNLACDSLLRVRLYITSTGTILQIVMHHIAVDLWSIDLIMDDVIVAMGGPRITSTPANGGDLTTTSGGGPFAARRPSSYIDYARHQQAMEANGTTARAALAWKRLLDVSSPRELAVLDLPTDYPRPVTQTFAGGIKVFQLPASLTCKLRALVQARRSTLYATLLSIVSIVLHKYARQDEVIIGTPMACRNMHRFEQTVGYFINAIPVRMCFTAQRQSFAELLASTTTYLMSALEHQDYPFPLIADRMVGVRSTSRTPVFQSLFTFQSAPLHEELVPFVMFQEGHTMHLGPKVSWESIAVPNGHAMYDLVFQFADLPAPSTSTGSAGGTTMPPPMPARRSSPARDESSGGGIHGTIEYNSDLFSAETIDRMVDVFEWVATQCTNDADVAIAQLSSAPPAQQEVLVKTYNHHPRSSTDAALTVCMGPNHTLSIASDDEATFPRVLATIATRYPNHPAIECGYPVVIPGGVGQTLMTFAQLEAKTNQIARVLMQRFPSVGANDIVGVSIRRSAEMLCAMIAVMKTGAAYVPIDPDYPPDRVGYMSSNAECRFIVCRQGDASATTFAGLPVAVLEDVLNAAEAESPDPVALRQPLKASDLAYVIYTSGSTGLPKGTLLEHRGLVNMCYAIQHGYRMKHGASKFLLFASASFDASVLELFAPLACASCVVMLSEKTIVGETLARAMAATNVTIAVLPPSVLSVMVEESFPPPSLQVLVTAGEAINDELLQRWRTKVHMLNGYGPTENTVCSTICDYDDDGIVLLTSHAQLLAYRDAALHSRLDRTLSKSSKIVNIVKQPPIGRPLANYRCYVLDEAMQLVGIGVPGELVVSGPGVARGYHKLPERTSLSFVPNPFDGKMFPRMYRTGDLVRWVGDGLLEFLGRIDQQVKLRGYRIELGEIESTILKFDGTHIADCAVDLRMFRGTKALIAYVVLGNGAQVEERREGGSTDGGPAERTLHVADIKAFIKKSLPDYMVPSAFVSVQALPLTPSGKVDRKNLPAPPMDDEAGESVLGKPAPQTPTQSVVLVLAKEVLGSSTVGIQDDFFEVGGHSLAAMQLVSRIRDHLAVDLSIAKLFELAKLSALADYVDSIRNAGDSIVEFCPNHLMEDPGGAVRPSMFPLSYNQESLWYAYTTDRSASTFNVSFIADVAAKGQGHSSTGASALDEFALEKAVLALAILNPMLRITLVANDTAPAQRVEKRLRETPIRRHTLERSVMFGQKIDEVSHEALDLEGGDVFRVTILRAADSDRVVIIFVFHHIVSDLGSMEIFLRQLGALYKHASSYRPTSFLAQAVTADLQEPVTPELKRRVAEDAGDDLGGVAGASYIDFVFYQREMIASPQGDRLLHYWQRQLSGYPAFTALPTDFVRPPRPSLKGGASIGHITTATSKAVNATARTIGTTPLTVYLTALFAWLFRVTGQSDVVIGMPVSNRNKTPLENVIGDFVNLCPLRLQLDGQLDGTSAEAAPSFRALARMSKSVLLGALTNQEYPFQLLVQNLQQYRDPSRSPIFQVLLVHEKTHHSMTDLSPFILGDAGGTLSLGDGALVLQSIAHKEASCAYDLVFALSEGDDDRVDFRIQYACDLFAQESVDRFAAQFVALLEAAVENPTQAITRLSMVPQEESTFLTARNNATRLAIASPTASSTGGGASVAADVSYACLHEAFEATVTRFPNHRALYDTLGNTYSYDTLNKCANAVATRIREVVRQHTTEDVPFAQIPVSVYIPRSVAYVVAVVAAAKSNCPYTPIDVKLPSSRVQYILEDSACPVVLTTRSERASLEAVLSTSSQACAVIFVDEILEAMSSASLSDHETQNPKNTSTWQDCLYTIYTSGSTGRPKGVKIHHGGVVNMVHWFVREHCVAPGDVSAQALGSGFDPVTVELWPYLLSGAAVVIMDDNAKFGGPEATLAFLDEHQVTHLTFPTVLSQMIFDGVKEFPPSLRVRSWSCGGDKFKGTNRSLPFALINAYGPTECCVLCSQYPINFPVPPRPADGSPMSPAPPEPQRLCIEPPLGTPTANTALYIIDNYGNLVPRGVVGELCVGGAQVGIGYRNRPDATEAVFTPDPFGIHADVALPPARIYHTGDLVKMDHDYNIHFIGRRDFQVKIRGFRIELGEIEAQLMHAAPDLVGHAVCIAYQPQPSSPTAGAGGEDNGGSGDASREMQLAAFLKVVDGAMPPPGADDAAAADAIASAARVRRSEIRQKLKGRLPDYMIPKVIVLLRELPLTPNGKVDRAQLPGCIAQDICRNNGGDDGTLLEGGGLSTTSTHVPPVTKDEQILCGIWEELLRTKPIGLTDNWYDKGGSSLTSTMLLSRMRQVFQMEISIQQFFGDPTVTGLLNIVQEKGNTVVAHSLTDVLERDASTLDPSITAKGGALLPYDANVMPQNIFITGVTGFLGAFILKQFLESLPDANIYCLVRAKTESEASGRIFKNLNAYQLMDDCDVDQWMSRVVPVVGDLAEENFGLSSARFCELAAVMDCIIHNGALVNFSYPYVSLKAANVGGTITALKLATTCRLKALHFISTLSTVPTPDVPGQRVVTERVLGSASDDLHGGYTQTKWVAERLVSLAATRGVPCTIIRPGRITGHQHTGACNLDDFLNLMIKGCIELGAIPDVQMPCEMTPVDFCAQAILDIALRHFDLFPNNVNSTKVTPTTSTYIYHLTNTSAMPWLEVMRIVVRQGNYGDLPVLPYNTWRQEHLLQLNNKSHCALIPLVPMFGEDFEKDVAPLDIRIDHLLALLKQSGTTCPETSESLVMTYVKYFVERGFLPRTAGTANSQQE